MVTKILGRFLRHMIKSPSSQKTIRSKHTFSYKKNSLFLTWKQAILEVSQKQGYTCVAL